MAFLVFLARSAWTGIVAAGPRCFIPDGRILQLVTRDEAPLSLLPFKQTLLAVVLILSVLRIPRLERDEGLAVVDLLRLDDL